MKIKWFGLFTLCFFTMQNISFAQTHAGHDHNVIGQAQGENVNVSLKTPLRGFELVNEDKKIMTLNDFKGSVWVANFIFTSCAGSCPIMVGSLAKLLKDYKDDSRVKLASFSVDPTTDTPDVFKKYANDRQINWSNWYFLTGSEKIMSELMFDQFKLGYAESILFHSDRIVLVDKQGQIRGYYKGTEYDDYKKLEQDLKKVLSE